MTFIGIDPSAGEKPFSFAALDQELNLLALGNGNLSDILAFAAGQQSALAAICGPRQPNTGLMADDRFRQGLSTPPNPGRYENFRVAEYLLRLHNISIPQTPRRSEDCPNWMRNAFTLFQKMSGFDYRLFPDDQASCQVLEVYPHSCYTALMGVIPFTKHSLEGRIQRQLVLQENGVQVPDAMDFFEEITRHRLISGILPEGNLYSAGELDALIGAFVAFQAAKQIDQVIKVGHADEGEIYIPVAELKTTYR